MPSNRNSHFSSVPQMNIQRSRMDRSSEHITTANIGVLFPIFWDTIVPADTMELKTSFVARLQTLITPVFGNLRLELFHFFVPTRLVWEHAKEYFGENTSSAWAPEVEYTKPQVVPPEGGWTEGTLADYFGFPTKVDNYSIDGLLFKAYALIVREWFVNQNVQDPPNVPLTDATITGSNGDNYITDLVKGGKPFTVRKYYDYFTGALPQAQKGKAAAVSLLGEAPVYGNGMGLRLSSSANSSGNYMVNLSGAEWLNKSTDLPLGYTGTVSGTPNGVIGVPTKEKTASGSTSGLVADLTGASEITISALRTAFQIQKFLELSARTGTRYTEVIRAHFGVISPDARLQRPEYLGGESFPLNIHQVVQNSATDATSPQGNVAGYSLTANSHGSFIHSFTENGYLISLACIRYEHGYNQGIDRRLSAKTKYEEYWPLFQHLSEQAILNKEIFVQGSDVVDDNGDIIDEQVFGYQERYGEYRYSKNLCTGEMRSNATTSLDVWHLFDDYDELPHLSDEWIREDKSNVDRALAVSSEVSNQALLDFWFDYKCTRPMGLFGIPGLVDHF